jgi:hypothetical protein
VVLYHLKRKEDTLTSFQLLVIWGCKSYGFYSRAFIIEHESIFSWNEDKLKRLYDVYNSQYDKGSHVERWLLDDNTRLETECKLTCRNFEMNVIIFEDRFRSIPPKPLWVDLNR